MTGHRFKPARECTCNDEYCTICQGVDMDVICEACGCQDNTNWSSKTTGCPGVPMMARTDSKYTSWSLMRRNNLEDHRVNRINTLRKLSSLILSADEPSRDLDCQIAVLCEGYFEVPPRFEGDTLGYGYERDGQQYLPGQAGDQLVPFYTASMDAVLNFRQRACPSLVLRVAFTPTGLVQVQEAGDAEDEGLKIVLPGPAKVGGLAIVHTIVETMIARLCAAEAE